MRKSWNERDASQAASDLVAAGADPFVYTSGRWLHRDKLQRETRYLEFDFAKLCQRALDVCAGSSKILRYEKKEGGFNRVFILHTDNGLRVVARLPFRVAGPRRLTTNSEVATMAYISSHTSIPVPKVLDWSDDDTNPVGAEYILMEHARGVQLHDQWPNMDTHQHMLCVKALANAVQEMANLRFPAYGSLYFSNAPFDQKSKVDFTEEFCVGPHCGTQYWDCNAGESRHYQMRKPNQGPWTNLEEYCKGLLDAGYSKIPARNTVDMRLPYQGSIQEHLRLLDVSESVISQLIKSRSITEIASRTLLHPDLNKRNIYVSPEDPTRIMDVGDWQSTSIEPTFAYANETPDLVVAPPDVNSIPEMNEDLAAGIDDPEGRELRERDHWICRQTFEVAILGWCPELHAARATDETLLRPFRYCNSSWTNSAAALRQELIQLSLRWNDLGLPGSCPYLPTELELVDHAKQYEDFETVQKFKVFLMRALDSNPDGWVPSESWQAAKEAHKALFAEWMATVRESEDPEMTEERGRKLWPWNER